MNLSYRIGHIFFRALGRGWLDLRIIGAENLHLPGAALIASNHVSFLDPPLVGTALDEAVHYFARKTLFDHPLAGAILRSWQSIPIDRDKPDASSLKATIRILRQGGKIVIFPEGTRSPDGRLRRAEPGIGLFIAKTHVPIIPVRLFGTDQALPRGALCLRPARVTLVVGTPWHPTIPEHVPQTRELYQALADEVMERIAGLGI